MTSPTPSSETPAAVSVVKTGHGQQVARILLAAVMALGACLEIVTRSQAQIEAALPGVKWLGAALLAAGLVGRMIQEILLVFDIHTVKTVPRT